MRTLGYADDLYHDTKGNLLQMTLGDLLDAQELRIGESECLVNPSDGKRMTYKELAKESRVAAANLIRMGIRKGDMEILIADDYHHQSLILPLNTPINVGYLYSFILDWYRVDTQDVVIVAVHNTSISGANLIDNIKDELIQQLKTEYDIFIEAMKGR